MARDCPHRGASHSGGAATGAPMMALATGAQPGDTGAPLAAAAPEATGESAATDGDGVGVGDATETAFDTAGEPIAPMALTPRSRDQFLPVLRKVKKQLADGVDKQFLWYICNNTVHGGDCYGETFCDDYTCDPPHQDRWCKCGILFCGCCYDQQRKNTRCLLCGTIPQPREGRTTRQRMATLLAECRRPES